MKQLPTVADKQCCNPKTMRHSKPTRKPRPHRHKPPKKVIQVRALRQLFPGLELSTSYGRAKSKETNNLTVIDTKRIKGENSRTPDNRGIRSGLPETGNQHTLGHLDCPACLRTRLMLTESAISPGLMFSDASTEWIERMTFQGHRGTYVSPRSIDDFKQYRRALNKTFEKIPLDKIHLGHLGTYQVERSQFAGPNRITQELGMLIRILKAANLWTIELDQRYRPLKHEEPDIPRALSPAQQKQWLEVCASIESLQVIYWYSLASIRTTARTCEMRKLQLGDLNLDTGLIYIRRSSSKTRGSQRSIPLTEDAVWAFERLRQRAETLGATDPQHYLFPIREKRGVWLPSHPMSTSAMKKPWNDARAATGIDWFDPYGLRHTGITRLAEVGTPVAVIMSYSGHLTTKMVQHYTAISEQSKRKWADLALEVETRKPSVRQMWKSGTGMQVSS